MTLLLLVFVVSERQLFAAMGSVSRHASIFFVLQIASRVAFLITAFAAMVLCAFTNAVRLWQYLHSKRSFLADLDILKRTISMLTSPWIVIIALIVVGFSAGIDAGVRTPPHLLIERFKRHISNLDIQAVREWAESESRAGGLLEDVYGWVDTNLLPDFLASLRPYRIFIEAPVEPPVEPAHLAIHIAWTGNDIFPTVGAGMFLYWGLSIYPHQRDGHGFFQFPVSRWDIISHYEELHEQSIWGVVKVWVATPREPPIYQPPQE